MSSPASISALVVEDDPLTRMRLCDAITAQPDIVLSAAFDRMRPALEWLRSHPVQLLLVNLGLPDGSGLDVIAACAARYPQCDIMVVTMFGDEKNVLSSIEAGAAGYILKDAESTDIVQAIREMRAGGAPMSPLIARKVLGRVREQVSADMLRPVEPAKSEVVLTRREAQTLDLIARGYTYEEVARLLSVSISTVQTHIRAIYGKLAVKSRGEAVCEAHKLGLLKP